MIKKIVDGHVNVGFERVNTKITITLEAVQYRLDAMSQYELFLAQNHVLLAGRITAATEEHVTIEYELPVHAQSVSDAVKQADLLERIEIARQFSVFMEGEADIAQPFIHPENLFLISNQLYVAHRGLMGSIEPKGSSFKQLLQQYKALVVSTLNPKYNYEAVVTGKAKIRDKAFRAILEAKSASEVEQVLDEQYNALYTARKVAERSVKKSKYSMFRILTIGFGMLVIVIGIWLVLLLENMMPRQNRIIEAQAAYMVNNYNEATNILADDDPRTLPPTVQYMLAASYVQLSNLTVDQRQAVINNLSPASHESELRYWIYIGRGFLLEALDIAYSLGDNQLKLNAYAHLYDYVYADMDMPGTDKQNYLNRYRQSMEDLIEELEAALELPEQIYEEGEENGEN